MKKISFYFTLLVALMLSATTVSSCSDDDDENDPIVNPDPEEKFDTITVYPYHFDITVTVGQQGGMGRNVTTIMQSVDSLNGGPQVDFRNQGGEINATYSMETILKGKYYYQVPFTADRFTKFEFKNDRVQVVQEQKFNTNTYVTRNYAHAWLSDSTFIVLAANGDKNAIIWTKLNANDMTIIGEGTLDISVADGWESFTTTGIVAYRQSDDKLFYFYYNKKGTGRKATNEKFFHVATINASTMAVEQDIVNTEANEMAGSAYGELLQQTTFFDENDNLYLAAFNDTDAGEMGKLLRIKKGQNNFEAGYDGFPNSDGKLLTVQYMGNGKVFAYSRHDDSELGTAIDSYAHYYSVIDLNTKTRTRMAIGGQDIPYSSGRFSQRSAFAPRENKMYFGVNTESAQPCVYVYDVATSQVSEGVKIAEGYYFEQIRLVEEDPYIVVNK